MVRLHFVPKYKNKAMLIANRQRLLLLYLPMFVTENL